MRAQYWNHFWYQMSNRHLWQLKKSKSWGPFWSYQLNSTANSAHLAHFCGESFPRQCDYRLPGLLKTHFEIKLSLKNCGKYWRGNPRNSFNPDTTVFMKNMLDYHFQNIQRSTWNSNLKMYCLISIAFLMPLRDIIKIIWIKIKEIPTR